VTIGALVTSNSASRALVDVEVYGPTGARVFQGVVDNQQFSAGQPRTLSVSWDVPSNAAVGTYTVKVGVFKVGWGILFAWGDAAAHFTVY